MGLGWVKMLARWWHSPTLNGLWLATGLSAIWAIAAVLPLTPHDLWFHLRLGKQMVETHALVLTDTFSYTQFGHAYFSNGWLGDVLLFEMWNMGGAPSLVLVRAICVTLFYALFGWLAWRASGNERLSAAWMLIGALASFPHWQMRTQTLVLPLFALFVWILTRDLKNENAPLYLLPLLMILWVNLHGTFVLGGLLMSLAWLGRLAARAPLRRMTIWSGATCAAVLVNPLGLGILNTVSEIGQDSSIQSWVLEWLPPSVREFPAGVFYFLITALLVGLMYSRTRVTATQLFWAIAFIWLGWMAYRNVLWSAAMLAPILAVQWNDMACQAQTRVAGLAEKRWFQLLFQPRPMGAIRITVFVALAALTIGTTPQLRAMFGINDLRAWVSSDTPVAVVDLMRAQNMQGRIFHEIGAGSYLLWALHPQQVFVDSRISLYPAAQWREYFAVTNASDGFETILAKYQIEYVLVDEFWQPQLLSALESRPRRWELLFQDGESYLFRRLAID